MRHFPMHALWCCAFWMLCEGHPLQNPPKIIFDTDTAMTVVQKRILPIPTDIDDDLAVLMAVAMQRRGNISIQAIISTFGNANSSATYEDATALATQSGIPQSLITRGGDFKYSLDTWTAGAQTMYDHLLAAPPGGAPTLLCIGSMFTLASVVTRNQTIVQRLGDVVLLGGSINQGHYISKNLIGDLNFKAHPEATNVVLAMPIRKVVMTMDLCMQLLFTAEHLAVLQAPSCGGSVIAAHLPRVLRWMRDMGFAEREAFHLWSAYGNASHANASKGGDSLGPIPWDPIALSYVTNPEWFGDEKCFEMHLRGKAVVSQEVPCANCVAKGWSGCVVAPTTILRPQDLLDSITANLCDLPL